MNSHFDTGDNSRQVPPASLRFDTGSESFDSTWDESYNTGDALDNLKRDRFELLSAYLDGEVTPEERQQVRKWLDTDPEIKSLYNRLMTLRDGIQTMPIPSPAEAADTIADQVFAKMERRSRKRWAWGGMAIAAAVVGAVSTFSFGTRNLSPQLAGQNDSTNFSETVVLDSDALDSDALMIALDRPIVDIPALAVTDDRETPPKSLPR